MADLLVSCPDPRKGIQVMQSSIATLLENFSEQPTVTPLLVFGQSQCGKSLLLERLLRESGEVRENPFSGRSDGVYVWPHPVTVNDRTFLLIKASSDPFQEDSVLAEAEKKILCCLLIVSSVCCLCMERPNIFRGLEYVQAVQQEVESRMHFRLSKCLVFAADESVFQQGFLSKSMIRHKSSPLASATEFLYRGKHGISEDCFQQVKSLICNGELHSPFTESRGGVQAVIKGKNFAGSLISLLEQLLLLSTLQPDFPQFLNKLSTWTTLDTAAEIKISEQRQRCMHRMCKASAQALFTPYFDTVVINDPAIKQICREFVFETPTVVLTVIGPQGQGKSAMLNELIRVCAECKTLKDYFRTSSSNSFVTRGADVLSHPLSLGNFQLMVIDMEGIGGQETVDDRAEDVQELILSSILCLTSVPCIIVQNSLQSFVSVEKTVHRICSLTNRYGFSMECIHLLLQDKPPRVEDQFKPKDLDDFVKRLNEQYFGGLGVIRVRNKPNFRSGNMGQVNEFLQDLLADSCFPKRNYSGGGVNLGNLLETIKYHVKYGRPLADLHVDPQHREQADFFLSTRKRELETIFNCVKSSSEGMHLEALFNEFFRNGISFFDCDRVLENVKDYVNIEICKEISSYRLRLAQIENCFRLTGEMTGEELQEILKQYLSYLYRESWVLTSFMDRSNELKLKLEEMLARYPAGTSSLSVAMKAFNEKQESLRNWFIVNYVSQGVAIAATGGLGAIANGARAAVMAARFGYAAAAGGFVFASRLAYGTITTLAMTEKATRLFQFSKDYPRGTLDKAMSFFRRAALKDVVTLTESFAKKVDALPANTQVSVLLVIGGKKMMSHAVLNEMVQCVSPFTCSHRETFVDEKSSQSLFFAYTRCHRQLRDQAVRAPSQGLIIYLRFKKNENHRKYRMLRKIASELILRVSSVCVFVNEENQHLKSLFDSLHMQAQVQMRTLLMPRVFAFAVGRNKASLSHDLRQKLRRCGGFCEVREVSELSASEVRGAVVSLKSDLDHSSSMTKEDLLALLSTIIGQSNALD